jgi:MFS family permease
MSGNASTKLDSRLAWVVVFAAFLGSFVSFGVTYCFGVFLKPMAIEFHANHAVMSALFSTITGLSFFLAPLTGDVADHYGPRPVVGAGAVLIGAGLILTAHVHSLPLIFVTYGAGVGTAVACTYIPAIAAVGEWFKLRRDIALGIAISGIGCGTLVAAPLAANLIERYGWRETFEIFGWISTALMLLCAALLARPPALGEKKKISVKGKMRTRGFGFLYISLLFSGIAIYVSFVFLPAYAVEIGASRTGAARLLGYIGASSVVGRLGLNLLAPRFGLIAMYRVSYAALLVSFSFWLMAHSYLSLVAFALVMGVGYGGIAAMAPAVTASLFGVEGLGELLGILFTGFGVACLIGPPLAGALVDYTLDYKWAVFVAVAASAVALIFVFPLRRSS